MLLSLAANIKYTSAQHTMPDTLYVATSGGLSFDGRPDDSAWLSAVRISNFTQRELHFGKPATEKTETAIIYDKLAMYIGVWCFQSRASIHAKFMQRDFNYEEDDNFQVALSPFSDRRNGYLFVINPNGARADLLIAGSEEGNQDWNGVWDAKTFVSDEGWFAEIRIPFNSLQFKDDSLHNWSINFERDIRSKNEQVLWQGWSRDCSIFCFVNAGILTGLQNIGYAKHFELKPYALGGLEKIRPEPTDATGKIGGDLNVNLTPTLKLNLTVNTDFAQVEADRIAVNLTRFDLYYPEKREFFLEGHQNYQFNLDGENELFYTRKIGIEHFESVPVIAGVRLFGKVGADNIGLLNIQTGKKGDIPATNNTVIRYKRDIGSQSYIGAILTSKNNSDISNQVAGIDGAYSTSKFLKNKNLVIGSLLSRSFDRNTNADGAYTWRFFIDYPNDFIDNFMAVGSIQQNYNPDLGFIDRKNYDNYTWYFRFTPRWFTSLGIRKMSFKPWGFKIYKTHTTGELESVYNETRPLGFFTRSGESFEYNIQNQFERLDQPFNITDSIQIPSGKYWMLRQDLKATTFQGRRVWVQIDYNWGQFYSGHINTFGSSLGININRRFNLRTDYIYNYIQTPQGNSPTNELAEFINYAFNPKLDLSFFVQWNSLDDLLFGNVRLHWIPKVGEDIYVVYNRGYDKLKSLKFSEPESSSAVVKVVWRFVF